jgi:hypothetical protein
MLLISKVTFSQDLFKIGVDYCSRGQYYLADSIFSVCMKQPHPDPNLMFNYASTRLYLQDTSTFCDIMWTLGHTFLDKDAENLYFKNCGTPDTTYFDKDFIRSDKKHARFTEILVDRKQRDYKIGVVHDKRSKGKSDIINFADLNNIQKSDIIAQYKLFNNGSKLYLFTLMPPRYVDGNDARRDYIANSPIVKEAKEKLQVSKLVVYVNYIVEKDGNIKNIEIRGLNKPVEDTELLTKYTNLIISNLPRQNPGQFNNENVDFEIETSLSFW